jgi:hypothetical protein
MLGKRYSLDATGEMVQTETVREMIVFLMFALTVLTQVFAQTPGQSEPENPSSKREQEFS